MPAERRARMPVAELMREPLLVPESLTVDRLLDRLSGRRTMAVVIDEYGGTAGVATLEDIVEEVVGEVRDEHDPHETPELAPAGTDERAARCTGPTARHAWTGWHVWGSRCPRGRTRRWPGWSRPSWAASPPSATPWRSRAGGWTSRTPRDAGRPGSCCTRRSTTRAPVSTRGGRAVTALQLLIGLATLVVNAFFVGAEFALISVRRSQVEPYAEEGDRRAKSVLWGLQHVSALMAAAQLGITLCTLVLGVVAEPAIAHLLEPVFHAVGVPSGAGHAVSFVIALALATYLHMLLGEMVPKNIALAEPVRSALLLGPPLVALSRALRPVIFTVNAFANALLKLLRVETKDEVSATFTDAELAQIVKDASEAGLIDDRAQERLHDALELGRRPVRTWCSRWNASSTRGWASPRSSWSGCRRSPGSRFPVVDDGRRIVGYLHVKDALTPRRGTCRSARRHAAHRTGAGEHPAGRRAHRDAPQPHPSGGRPGLRRAAGGLVTMEDVLRELFGQRA